MTAASKVLATVNAPYGADLTAAELANAIMDLSSVECCSASVFSFFSDVSPGLQEEFIIEMGVDKDAAAAVAEGFRKLAGYGLALADQPIERFQS